MPDGFEGHVLHRGRAPALGVRRISVGSALSRAALGGFIRAAREIRERGTFAFADEAVPFGEINDLMGGA
jgi:2-methylisocitrate lyase-like PEP mutase family enzyme